jgi:hypothetical protein
MEPTGPGFQVQTGNIKQERLVLLEFLLLAILLVLVREHQVGFIRTQCTYLEE